MLRALFEKTGNAAYISHLDLMRLFQRAFKRAGLPLTHTQGFNPRPSVSIALPLSLGMESHCELLDFSLEGEIPDYGAICDRLNEKLVEVLQVYDGGEKLKNLALLQCRLTLEYDEGIPPKAIEKIMNLFSREKLTVEKKGKNGVSEQDIIPLLRRISIGAERETELRIDALVHCQNPALNPMQLVAAIRKNLPELSPDFVRCCRMEILNESEEVFR